MDAHAYRSIATPVAPRAEPRRWGEIDAELLAAVLCLALVIAGLLGHCGQTGTTVGLLGLLGSSCAIAGWLRRDRRA